MTAISLYGLMDERSDASVHRSLSDLTPVFEDEKQGKFKIISFYAKKARGLMARFVIDKRVQTVEGLKAFDREGYVFQPELSSEDKLVFRRSEQDAKAK